jgi:hypothetical protein
MMVMGGWSATRRLRWASRLAINSSAHFLCILRFVAMNPPHKFLIRTAFQRNSTNEFSDEVLAITSSLASTFVNSNFQNLSFNLLARSYLFRFSVFSGLEFQNRDIVALFPLPVSFFSHVVEFSCNDVCALQPSASFGIFNSISAKFYACLLAGGQEP